MQIRILLIFVAVNVLAARSHADEITLGTANTGYSNLFRAGLRFQQVYDGSLFTGTRIIDTISFYASTFAGGGSKIDNVVYTITLSTTSAMPGVLSADFATNRGSPVHSFFSGTPMKITGYAPGERIELDGLDYSYNSSAGNLLVEIVKSANPAGPSDGDLNILYQSSSTTMSNLSSTSEMGNGDVFNGGIVTTFKFQAVPEPSPLVTLAVVGCLGTAFRRRNTPNVC
ncbi:MAG: hypothetical protein KDB22_12705 [Planctomycetales bacterium]|nr:hypothetical protein [Planctomycetales bacterium]